MGLKCFVGRIEGEMRGGQEEGEGRERGGGGGMRTDHGVEGS